MSDVSNATVAEKLGVSLRYVYLILEKGTTNRELATKLAKLKRENVNKYYRASNRRGRERPYTFSDFIMEAYRDMVAFDGPNDFTASTKREKMILLLAKRYNGAFLDGIDQKTDSFVDYQARETPSLDYSDLESLLDFLDAIDYPNIKEVAPSIWKEFRIWRETKICEDNVLAIKAGQPLKWEHRPIEE